MLTLSKNVFLPYTRDVQVTSAYVHVTCVPARVCFCRLNNSHYSREKVSIVVRYADELIMLYMRILCLVSTSASDE